MSDPSAAGGLVPVDLPFRPIAELLREHAQAAPHQSALVDSSSTLDYGALDALMDRVAASLQRDGVGAGDSIAICAINSTRYAAIFLGALRAGVVVAPLAASVTPASFRSMLADAGARLLFVDAGADDVLGDGDAGLSRRISLDGVASGTAFDAWLAAPGSAPHAVEIRPEMAFNIIYSSGTTGTP
ncbi:MAG TPA: class I adenylate-forming enzyme family protein, partial [Caldimonas sp.]|nr:class I adenylate-forming enzyme family protein [Caldimonas sp.]